MTENIPPVPPAPEPQPQPQGYPSYPAPGVDPNQARYAAAYQYPAVPPAYGQQYPAGPPVYGQPQYQAPYQQPAPRLGSYPPYPYAPAGYPGQPKARASGRRIAAGILGIILGAFILIPALAGLSNGTVAFLAFLILLAALGNITAGILLLANQRARTKWAPVTLLSTTGATILLGAIGLTVDFFGVTLLVIVLPVVVPICVLLGLGLASEKRGA